MSNQSVNESLTSRPSPTECGSASIANEAALVMRNAAADLTVAIEDKDYWEVSGIDTVRDYLLEAAANMESIHESQE